MAARLSARRVADERAYVEVFRSLRRAAVLACPDDEEMFDLAAITCAANPYSREVVVRTAPGRLCRPLLVASRAEAPWNSRGGSLAELVRNGLVEYVDAGAADDPAFIIATTMAKLREGAETLTAGAGAFIL